MRVKINAHCGTLLNIGSEARMWVQGASSGLLQEKGLGSAFHVDLNLNNFFRFQVPDIGIK
jgi:hypothetical protein